VKTAVEPLSVTVPDTEPAPVTRNVPVVTVDAFTSSENVASMVVVGATPAAPFPGMMATTVGGVVSGTGPVVKDQMYSEASGFPARSFTPAVTRAV
jgi:hypothetical protein